MKPCEVLKQQIEVMLDTVNAHQSAIGFLPALQQPVETAIVVDPSKSPFHFPTLPTVALVLTVFGGPSFGNRDMVFAIRDDRNDPAVTQLTSQGFTVVAFVQPQSLGASPPLAHPEAIDRFQNVDLVMAVGPAQSKVQGMAVSVDDDMPFQA
jgi:hypothetical protein